MLFHNKNPCIISRNLFYLFDKAETLTDHATNSIFAESSHYPLRGHNSNEEHPRCLSITEGKKF